MGLLTAFLAGLLAGVAASPLNGQESPSPVTTTVATGEVARVRIGAGPELWVAGVPGEGRVGITLVFAGGGPGGGPGGEMSGGPGGETILRVARALYEACPEAAPVPGAGPDYETLSLAVSAAEVEPVLVCLSGALDAAGEIPRSEPASREATSAGRSGESAPPTPNPQEYRTASGALLATLYAPAPVPGGSLGAAAGGSPLMRPSHVIVVGSVDRRRVERWVREAFREGGSPSRRDSDGSEGADVAGGSDGSGRRQDRRDGSAAETAEESVEPRPHPPVATEVLVLDRPGESLADLRVGQLVLPGNHPDWSALVVAREILADRLQGGPWAFAELLRVRGPGAFIAGSRLPVDVVPDAVIILLTEIEGLGDRLPGDDEVRTAATRLADAFAGAIAGAPALADEFARVAALGLGPEAVTDYPRRLGSLTPDAVRRAVREHLDPGRMVVAATGDGAALSRGLSRFGPVRRVLPPSPPSEWPGLEVDGSVLRPGTSRYRVLIGGQEVGTAQREVVKAEGDRIRFRSVARIGEGELTQEIEAALPDLAFMEAQSLQGGRSSGSLRREGDRLVVTDATGTPLELALRPGTVVSDLLEPTLWASTLQVGANHRVPVVVPGGGAVQWAGVQVLARDTIKVPAGTFETFRVAVTGPEILTLWLQVERPHRTVRLLGANGVVLELVEEGGGAG